jgi:hypothetical protein
MDHLDNYLKRQIKKAWAVEPPKSARYHLLQEIKQSEVKARRRTPRVLDLVEYEYIHGHGLRYLGLATTLQANPVGLLKLA